MKPRTVLLSIMLFSSTLLVGQNYVKRSYDLEAFSEINASFIYEIDVYRGDSHTLELDIPEELQDDLEIRVTNNTLNLGVTRKEWWRTAKSALGNRYKVKARVIMPVLEGIELSNLASLYMRDGFTPANFWVRMTGASNATVNVMTHAANIDINGASTLEISGLATITKAYVNGASTLLYKQETEQIELQAGGASTVIMKGSSISAGLTVSGASQIKAADFITEKMDLRCSGASGADVHVSGKIGVTAVGASRVHIKGNPGFTKTVSRGASSINTY
ncbi:MAG: DUF2807 domain-containing protein [Bacteroidales bacterium]|jgi:hypothetical protein|nr:DUF2807 domain-containing protein [Bacteroidales bacterium]MDD2264252.1 DUF2807 domain-containing protein [Bacteroidales bacterium]MDD2831486.1 DUF2807 domain-containing protein [Bacteroidales bacterium]MDD3208480.1 DUF2807 domain-containing protein [Bacteroidales bacterium]MDD3697107.1 DUF2807 domain-containing protein [Bacteroidales bacterium]